MNAIKRTLKAQFVTVQQNIKTFYLSISDKLPLSYTHQRRKDKLTIYAHIVVFAIQSRSSRNLGDEKDITRFAVLYDFEHTVVFYELFCSLKKSVHLNKLIVFHYVEVLAQVYLCELTMLFDLLSSHVTGIAVLSLPATTNIICACHVLVPAKTPGGASPREPLAQFVY